MALALRNKQIFALIALAVLTLLVIAFVVLSVVHISLFQALNANPDAFRPWL